MAWSVDMAPDFETEFNALSKEVKKEIFVKVKLLMAFGPQLKRPHADTLSGSAYDNMKELRLRADDGVWRVAFAFDPGRQAILLVAGDKSGDSQKLFYKRLIKKADKRFASHLEERSKVHV